MPGWQALVNGQPATITTLDGVYQGVAVPAGTSSVTYSFLPPHEFDAVLAALLAVLFILGTAVYERRRRPKSQVETTDETTDGTTDETTDETTNETL